MVDSLDECARRMPMKLIYFRRSRRENVNLLYNINKFNELWSRNGQFRYVTEFSGL
jgi:hypothetical protein